ncbi:MAG: hypothetical protein ABWY00_04190 [Dongiaceae bacterium]
MMGDRNATYMKIADFLIPAYRQMPAFSTVCDMAVVESSIGFRPDVKEAFNRGLQAEVPGDAEAMLEHLNTKDREAFDAITLITVTTYYMTPRVRELIGYPGQENVSYDSKETQVYLTDGSLGQVIARGRKYKPTPGL